MSELPPPTPTPPVQHGHDITGTVVAGIAGVIAGVIALVILAVTVADDASTYLIGAAFGLAVLGFITLQNRRRAGRR